MHGSWCWEPVLEGLRSEGVPAIAVDLPGRGSSRSRKVSPAESVAVVREAIDASGGPAVLCAHSAGGLPITVVDDVRVAHRVYIAAFMPGPDDRMGELSHETSIRIGPHLV